MIQEFKPGSFLSLKENSSVYMGHVFYFKVKIFVRFLLGGEINIKNTGLNLCQYDRYFLAFSDTTRNERHLKSNENNG